MLFHITSTHTPGDCPISGRQAGEASWSATLGKLIPPKDAAPKAWAGQHGVTTHYYGVDGPGHTVYMVIEASDGSRLAKFLQPIKSMSHTEVVPVGEYGFPTGGANAP